MSTTPPVPDINTPATQIAQANQVSQATPNPGQPPAATTQVTPPTTATPTGPFTQTDLGGGKVKIQYQTGEVFEGTQAEVLTKIAEAHVNTKQWARSEVDKYKNQPTQQTPVQQTPVQQQSPFASDQEKEIAEYTANLIAKTLGYPDAVTMRQALGHIQENTTDYASQTTSMMFQAATPDFNPTKENSEKLLQAISDSGMDEAFEKADRTKQVRMLQQAHAWCLMTKAYDPKPAQQTSASIPNPPPPPPTGRSNVAVGELPENLRPSINDTKEQTLAKWEQARALGLA